MVLSWKDVLSGQNEQPSSTGDKQNNEDSLNVLESLLNLQNVNIQIGNSKQHKETSVKMANNNTSTSLALTAQSSRIWPSASVHSDTYSLENVENALRLSESLVLYILTALLL